MEFRITILEQTDSQTVLYSPKGLVAQLPLEAFELLSELWKEFNIQDKLTDVAKRKL